MIKTIVKWGVVAFLIFYVVTQPSSAADSVHYLGNGAVHIANGFSSFVANLA